MQDGGIEFIDGGRGGSEGRGGSGGGGGGESPNDDDAPYENGDCEVGEGDEIGQIKGGCGEI